MLKKWICKQKMVWKYDDNDEILREDEWIEGNMRSEEWVEATYSQVYYVLKAAWNHKGEYDKRLLCLFIWS